MFALSMGRSAFLAGIWINRVVLHLCDKGPVWASVYATLGSGTSGTLLSQMLFAVGIKVKALKPTTISLTRPTLATV